jgi:hypothetical protein
MKTETNPFGAQLVVLAGDDASKKDGGKKGKTDLVKLSLMCVPSLESAKNDLLEVASASVNEDLKKSIADFVNQLEAIEEKVLALTMQGIKKERQDRLGAETPPEITPGMFSGAEPLPGEEKPAEAPAPAAK